MSAGADGSGDSGAIECVSRLPTLQSLLSLRGAPGSRDCLAGGGDLVPVPVPVPAASDEALRLHPHLVPIARSTGTGGYVCALRRAYADDADYESSSDAPLPIVEARPDGFGMRLLALNSEHLMRRIAAAADGGEEEGSGDEDALAMYNDGLGQGLLPDSAFDNPYEAGSVAKLGYGLEKYALLRIGPFPDLYESMALSHQARGDEQSSLIAAEASNGKFTGFGSTFAFYARLLSTFPSRSEEARDAARMCLRLPIPSAALDVEGFAEIAVLAELATKDDTPEEALAKMRDFYEKVKDVEKEEQGGGEANMTPEQAAIEAGNELLDQTAFSGGSWADVRKELAEIYASAGRFDMSNFVNPDRA